MVTWLSQSMSKITRLVPCSALQNITNQLLTQSAVVVVVELPQAPEDDSQKRQSCAWKAVELVTVGVCVW